MSASGRAICAILALAWTVAAFATPAEALSWASRCPSEHDADSFSTKGAHLGGPCKGTKYDYDPHDRLTGEKWKNAYLRNAKWTYDPAGNRLTQKIDGVESSYTCDAQNRLTSETKAGVTTSYLNDKNGNRTRKTVGTVTEENYGFDYMNRISAYAKNPVGLPATSSFQYLFTPTAERIAKVDLLSPAGNEEWFMYDGADVTADYTRTTGTSVYTLDRTYANGRAIDSKLARFDNPGEVTYLYLGDALGTVHQEVTPTGTVVRQELTTAWGEAHPGYFSISLLSDRHGYTGREHDGESGLVHYRARSLDSSTGRFVNRDAFRGVNDFAYVLNNPVSNTDPSGKYEFDIHEHFTRWLASMAGFDAVDSWRIGRETQGVDDDPNRGPMPRLGDLGEERRRLYHMVDRARLANMQQAATNTDPSTDNFRAMGEYFHALEDSYSHQTNMMRRDMDWTFTARFGHVFSHRWDHPWWRPELALEMAEEVFSELLRLRQRHIGAVRAARTWQEIRGTARIFVQVNSEVEGEGNNSQGHRRKVAKVLGDQWLVEPVLVGPALPPGFSTEQRSIVILPGPTGTQWRPPAELPYVVDPDRPWMKHPRGWKPPEK